MFKRFALCWCCLLLGCLPLNRPTQAHAADPEEKSAKTVRADSGDLQGIQTQLHKLDQQLGEIRQLLTRAPQPPPTPAATESKEPPLPKTLKIQLRIEMADQPKSFTALGYAAEHWEISLPLIKKLGGAQSSSSQTGVGTLVFSGSFKIPGEGKKANLTYQTNLNTPFLQQFFSGGGQTTSSGQTTVSTGTQGSMTLTYGEEKQLAKTQEYSIWIKIEPDR
jgi:hypothetical protein